MDRRGHGSWAALDSTSVTVHSTSTVGLLEERVMVALEVESLEHMRCELSLGESVLNNSSMPLQQAGFSSQEIHISAKIFPATGKGLESQMVPSVADAMIQLNEYYQILFELADGRHSGLSSCAWRILELIPRSDSDDRELSKLEWESLFSESSLYRTAYVLQSINSKLRPANVGDLPSGEGAVEWQRSFVHAGGLEMLCNLLYKLVAQMTEWVAQKAIKSLLQMLTFLIDAVNDSVPDDVLKSTSQDAGAQALLTRTMSDTSKQHLQHIDTEQLAATLQRIAQCGGSGGEDLQALALRTLGAVAASTHSIASGLVSNPVVNELLTCSDRMTREAAAMLIFRISTSFPELFNSILEMATDVMLATIESGDVESCTEALDALLGMLEHYGASGSSEDALMRLSQLLQQLFKQLPSTSATAKWFELLASSIKQVSPETLNQIDTELTEAGLDKLATFLWKQLYETPLADESAKKAAAEAMYECCQSPEALQSTMLKVEELHKATLDRCDADDPETHGGARASSQYWFINPSAKEGATGLVNQGNTCYQNATLQQIYMHPKLRNMVLQSTVAKEVEETNCAHLFQQLQKALARLAYSISDTYNPRAFVKACENQFNFDVWGQQDASEFYSTLSSRIEEALKRAAFDEVTFLKTSYLMSATHNEQPVSRMGGSGELAGSLVMVSLIDMMTGEVSTTRVHTLDS